MDSLCPSLRNPGNLFLYMLMERCKCEYWTYIQNHRLHCIVPMSSIPPRLHPLDLIINAINVNLKEVATYSKDFCSWQIPD